MSSQAWLAQEELPRSTVAAEPNASPGTTKPTAHLLRIAQVVEAPGAAPSPPESVPATAATPTAEEQGTSSRRGPASRTKNLTFAEALGRIQTARVSFVRTKLQELQYGGDTSLSVNGEHYPLSPEAWDTFCRYLAIPPDLLPQLQTGLGSIVLKTLHGAGRKASGGPEELRLARNENGEIVSVAPATLAALSNQDITTAIEETLPSHISSQTLSVAALSLADGEFELAYHTEALVTEPRPGDVLRGGITIRHSQAGTAPTVVLGYIHRLVCSNGMTQRVCLAGRLSRTKRCKAGNSASRPLQAIKAQVAQAWAQQEERLAGIPELLNHPLEADGLPEGLRRRWSINRKVAGEISDALQRDELGRTGTEYDLVNAISRVATHSPHLAPRYVRHLSLAAGMFAQRHVHHCPMCGSWLTTPGRASRGSATQWSRATRKPSVRHPSAC